MCYHCWEKPADPLAPEGRNPTEIIISTSFMTQGKFLQQRPLGSMEVYFQKASFQMIYYGCAMKIYWFMFWCIGIIETWVAIASLYSAMLEFLYPSDRFFCLIADCKHGENWRMEFDIKLNYLLCLKKSGNEWLFFYLL